MKRLVALILFFGVSATAWAADTREEKSMKVLREGTEWCDIWIPQANRNDLPRILLVGDSITKGYYNGVAQALDKTASCARLATSANVADPVFLMQMETAFHGYRYALIHFNNGLHGFEYTEEEYAAAYERTLEWIRAKMPEAKIVLALTTPVQSTSERNSLNPRVDARNRLVLELAKKFGAEVNDLHAISKDHPEYYRDAYHYKPEAIEMQAQQVAGAVRRALDTHAK